MHHHRKFYWTALIPAALGPPVPFKCPGMNSKLTSVILKRVISSSFTSLELWGSALVWISDSFLLLWPHRPRVPATPSRLLSVLHTSCSLQQLVQPLPLDPFVNLISSHLLGLIKASLRWGSHDPLDATRPPTLQSQNSLCFARHSPTISCPRINPKCVEHCQLRIPCIIAWEPS